jgi:hypothetical protein
VQWESRKERWKNVGFVLSQYFSTFTPCLILIVNAGKEGTRRKGIKVEKYAVGEQKKEINSSDEKIHPLGLLRLWFNAKM